MYFCLYPDYSAKWVGDAPVTQTWTRTYTYKAWGQRMTFVSACPVSDGVADQPQAIKNLSLIKSNTQKTFRRCETAKCLSSFKTFASLSPKSALKRLVIIILEDGLFTPDCTALIWLQICSTFFDYQLTQADWSYVVSMIQYQCDRLRQRLSLHEIRQFPPMTLDNCPSSEPARSVALSLLLYNDKNTFKLAGDKVLPRYVIWKLSQPEFTEDHPEMPKFELERSWADIDYLPHNQLSIVACDFHVDAKLLGVLESQLGRPAKFLRKLIWYMSSRINLRPVSMTPDEQTKEQAIQAKYARAWDEVKATCYRTMMIRMLHLYSRPVTYTK